MTESDAKTKRCCGPEGCGKRMSSKSPYFQDIGRHCIASECMAWRWNFADHPNPEDRKKFDMEGYCGLAK